MIKMMIYFIPFHYQQRWVVLTNISSNSGKITTNEGNISSNLEKINGNKDDIIALQTSNVKAFYNLDRIFIYDIENGYKTVSKDNHYHIFEKEITHAFIKNLYLEIILKVLTEISNYVLIGYFQILCNFYDEKIIYFILFHYQPRWVALTSYQLLDQFLLFLLIKI